MGVKEVMPGMGRMNPRQMKQMMKRLGMEMNELDDVEAVIIKCRTKDIVITNPSVTIMDVKGQKSYQVTGDEADRRWQRGAGLRGIAHQRARGSAGGDQQPGDGTADASGGAGDEQLRHRGAL